MEQQDPPACVKCLVVNCVFTAACCCGAAPTDALYDSEPKSDTETPSLDAPAPPPAPAALYRPAELNRRTDWLGASTGLGLTSLLLTACPQAAASCTQPLAASARGTCCWC